MLRRRSKRERYALHPHHMFLTLADKAFGIGPASPGLFVSDASCQCPNDETHYGNALPRHAGSGDGRLRSAAVQIHSGGLHPYGFVNDVRPGHSPPLEWYVHMSALVLPESESSMLY